MLVLLPLTAKAACIAKPPIGCPPQLFSVPVGGEVVGSRESHQFSAKRLSARPTAFLLKNFLSPEECEAIKSEALDSGRVHAAETTGESDARKKCQVCTLPLQTPVVGALTNEAAQLLLGPDALGSKGAGCEDMHVLKYSPGGEYRGTDATRSIDTSWDTIFRDCCQRTPRSIPKHTVHYDGSPILPRVMTILYYLNGVGATWFPFADATGDDADLIEKSGRDQILDRTAALDPSSAGVLVEPSGPGDAVAFFNFDADGVRDPYSLHAGTTVGEGDDKWLAAHFFQAPSLVASSEAMRALAWRREQEALNAAQGISDELEAAK